MTDQFDRAQQLDAFFRSLALASHGKNQPVEVGPSTCSDCDKVIPPGRRLAVPGCTRCLPCQQKWENNQR